MLLAIQQAYYLQAKNPSDDSTLIQLSADISLDEKQFEIDLFSVKCGKQLEEQLQLTRRLDVTAFPSLVLSYNESNTLIHINYTNSETIVSRILELV